MKKYFLMSLFICLVFCPILLAEEAVKDFRNVKWGMTRDEVMKTEDQNPIKSSFTFTVPKNIVAYNVTMFDSKVSLQYEFNNDILTDAFYIFLESPQLKDVDHNDPLKYYTDQYAKLKATLSQKYGTPVEDSEIWTNESFKNVSGSVGTHITKGHLIIRARWETDRTIIVINCLELLKLYAVYRNRIIYYEKGYYQSLQSPTSNNNNKELNNL